MKKGSRVGVPSGGMSRSWEQVEGPAHLVQFYADEEFLEREMARFFAAGLGKGEAALVVAVQPRLEALERRLAAKGIDLAAARSEGLYVPFEARDTLSRFMIDGWPDEARFLRIVGGMVSKVGTGAHRPVRAFGEMAFLLWREGMRDAAIRIEELWNELAQFLPFRLVCAYPMSLFPEPADEARLVDICAVHSHMALAEKTSGSVGRGERRTIPCLE